MVKASPVRRRAFVDVLLAEIAQAGGDRAADFGAGGGEAAPAPFDTLYLGGGTPSLHTPDELHRVLTACREHLGARQDAWIFLEANPEDVSREALAAWRELGVRTVSLGVQSFDDEELRFLGRRHSAEKARRAVELCREEIAAEGRGEAPGLRAVSVDLIYGLPGQTLESWRRNLEAAVELGPQHLSCYQLTVEDGTPFGLRRDRGRLVEMPDDDQARLFDLTHAFLADAGYPAYEVSSFAAGPEDPSEHQSRHNRKYWNHTPYLGLGPSAHSFDGRSRRWWNLRRLHPYQEAVREGRRPVGGSEDLSHRDLAFEALMLGLRTAAGVDVDAFEERFGGDLLALNRAALEDFAARGLLRVDAAGAGRRLVPTRRGLAVAEALAVALEVEVPEAEAPDVE